jgi:Fe-S-cluster containining protein
MSNKNKHPWYKDGLQFQCTGCGDCCTGAPGYVWVNREEITNLAARLGLEPDEFESRYVRNVGKRKSLNEYNNGDCVFFDGETRKCRVYEDRPRQCRTWPFWDSNVRSPEAWASTCQVCPGSGTGRLYQLGEIETHKEVIRI